MRHLMYGMTPCTDDKSLYISIIRRAKCRILRSLCSNQFAKPRMYNKVTPDFA